MGFQHLFLSFWCHRRMTTFNTRLPLRRSHVSRSHYRITAVETSNSKLLSPPANVSLRGVVSARVYSLGNSTGAPADSRVKRYSLAFNQSGPCAPFVTSLNVPSAVVVPNPTGCVEPPSTWCTVT